MRVVLTLIGLVWIAGCDPEWSVGVEATMPRESAECIVASAGRQVDASATTPGTVSRAVSINGAKYIFVVKSLTIQNESQVWVYFLGIVTPPDANTIVDMCKAAISDTKRFMSECNVTPWPVTIRQLRGSIPCGKY